MAAITQISRIQHRNGLRRELPNALNEAELGWALDTRQLFIGNGPIHPGNTEIITQHTPASSLNYSLKHPYAYQQLSQQGALVGSNYFTASTGFLIDDTNSDLDPRTFNATFRSYQEKFDEVVSVKDYGAVGDGNADDTGALVRAITDLYSQEYGPVGTDAESFRRNVALYLPAGVYRIRRRLSAYPGMTLVGDFGKSAILLDPEIAVDDEDDAVLVSSDSYGQTDFRMGQSVGDSESPPTYSESERMFFYGVSFQSLQTPYVSDPLNENNARKRQIVRLNRVSNVIFEKCSFDFIGEKWSPDVGNEDATAAVVISSFNDPDLISQHIKFINCSSSGAAYDFNIIDGARDIEIDGHSFSSGLTSVKIGYDDVNDVDPIYRRASSSYNIRNIKISNSTFSNYISYAIEVFGDAEAVTSFSNRFTNENDPSIRFGPDTNMCSSAYDWFDNTTYPSCGYQNPRVIDESGNATIFNAQDFKTIPIGVKDLYICGDLTITGSITFDPEPVESLEMVRISYPTGNISHPGNHRGNSIIINYAMRIPNNGSRIIRTGTLKIAYYDAEPGYVFSSGISYSDDYVEAGGWQGAGAGVTLSVVPDNTLQCVKVMIASTAGTPVTKTIVSTLTI